MSLLPKLVGFSIAGASGSYLLARQQTALAEETAPPAALVDATRRKLPIYDSPPAPATLIPTPSPLQDQVGEARRLVQTSYHALNVHAREGARQFIGWENSAEAHVRAILPEDEELTPGALYVGVATLAGSIVARNRNILLRAGLPTAFFFASLSHFLPKTFGRVSQQAEALESRYIPAFAGVRSQARGLVQDLKSRAGW